MTMMFPESNKMMLENVKPVVHTAECSTDDEEHAIVGHIKELEWKKKWFELEHREQALKEEMLSLTMDDRPGSSLGRTRSQGRSPSRGRCQWRHRRHTSSSSLSSDRTTSREQKA